MSKRDEFYEIFKGRGIHFASDNLSKPYLKGLSPGCETCVNGTWSCIYINGLCTRKCFFCPQDRRTENERRTVIQEGLEFSSPAEYSAYLKKHHFEGIGFSGGEPFLVFDRVLDYITEIRRVFGNHHYIWVYTNGDPVTEDRLRKLKEAGLDEIRFDLSAVDYDLKRISLAVKHMDTVTVEIPAIPEDVQIVKALIPQIEELGVSYLNVHQLMVTGHNWNALAQRGYAVVDADLYDNNEPILESELAALEILTHAVKIESQMGINYCSRLYKERFQQRGLRKRYALLIKKNDAAITDTGYLRKFWIKGSADETEHFLNAFSPAEVNEGRQQLEDGETGCFIPPDLFRRLLNQESFRHIDVIYFAPSIEKLHRGNHEKKRVITYGTNIKLLNTVQASRFTLANRVEAHLFYQLFIEGKDPDWTAREIMALNWEKKAMAKDISADVESFYTKFANMEYLPLDLPEYT